MGVVNLWHREYGGSAAIDTPILLVHGLFGSSANWHGIARRLGETRRVLTVDLRNHGRSPQAADMGYPDMAADLAALLEQRKVRNAVVIGHSMGGKAAMWLALSRPNLVERLVVADIAPVTYATGFSHIIDALMRLDLKKIVDRRDADNRLADHLPDSDLRDYLLQNLVRDAQDWHWRIDLATVAEGMKEIMSFPNPQRRQYPGPALFIYATESDYVSGGHLAPIRALFPLARLRAIPGAGHWVYAEQPDAFLGALRGFLAH